MGDYNILQEEEEEEKEIFPKTICINYMGRLCKLFFILDGSTCKNLISIKLLVVKKTIDYNWKHWVYKGSINRIKAVKICI